MRISGDEASIYCQAERQSAKRGYITYKIDNLHIKTKKIQLQKTKLPTLPTYLKTTPARGCRIEKGWQCGNWR